MIAATGATIHGALSLIAILAGLASSFRLLINPPDDSNKITGRENPVAAGGEGGKHPQQPASKVGDRSRPPHPWTPNKFYLSVLHG